MEEKQRILVVDDESVLCDVLKINLECVGYKVDTALSGEEALQKNLSDYDLFILDVMMDSINGFELASTIRRNAGSANTPIIFCTALDSEIDLIKGFDVGADDYIKKPYTLSVLLAKVKVILKRKNFLNYY